MKKIILSLVIMVISFTMIGCQQPVNNIIKPGPEYIQTQFIDKFESENPTWFNSKDGIKLLKEKFDSLMINDSLFYKSAIINEYYSDYTYNKYLDVSVQLHETIGKYENDSINDFDEVAAFVMSIKFKLSQPMYDGTDEYMFMYEVINKIPNTAPEHSKPYINNVDTCVKTNDGPKYFVNRYYSKDIISAFIIDSTNNF